MSLNDLSLPETFKTLRERYPNLNKKPQPNTASHSNQQTVDTYDPRLVESSAYAADDTINTENFSQGLHQQTVDTQSHSRRNSENHKNVTETRQFQLRFSKICKQYYRGESIKGEDGRDLMISIEDGQSGLPVTSGPEASATVEIVVLPADFGVLFGDSWTREEFKSKAVLREGNRKLLTGKPILTLKKGFGYLTAVGFPRTSRYVKICSYRLGVRVTDDDMGTKIKEGFTDSFVVKDGNIKSQKHHPPTLSSEVWRLDKIAKGGTFHRNLSLINVNTVEDLLEKLKTDDPEKLRKVVGNQMSARMWEGVLAQAQSCNDDESQKIPTFENSSDTNDKISLTMEKLDSSQPAAYINSKKFTMDDPNPSKRMRSTISHPQMSPIQERRPHIPVDGVPFVNGITLEPPDHPQNDGYEFLASDTVNPAFNMVEPSSSTFLDALITSFM